MPSSIQKLLRPDFAAPTVMSLNVQAAMGEPHVPERSQFAWLVRHFLERFFNHETSSPDADGKTRLVQLAFAAGIPGFMVAVYLWPVYHPFPGWPPKSTAVGHPSYWLQANHHLFFVIYSFVALGIITVFEWDLFFPDLLDVFVLDTLPLIPRKVFFARVTAVATLLVGFLIDTNFLAPIILPMSTDPPSVSRLLLGHIAAVAGAGIFSAGSILALQCLLVALLGERLFRKISLALQGFAVAFMLVLLLLFPLLSRATPQLLQSQSFLAKCFPPFWFLGIYQNVLDGASALPVFRDLARIGVIALITVVSVAFAMYPVAYLRRVKGLLEGAPSRARRNSIVTFAAGLIDSVAVRKPIGRAVFHFISQTIFRVPRYRVYLVLYGGVGLSVLVATVLRISVSGQQLHLEASADGIRVAVGIAAFWSITGFRTAFVSSGNQRGSWIFRLVHGTPAAFNAAIQQFTTAKTWVTLCSVGITLATVGILRLIAPPELLSANATAAQLLVGIGMCILLTDLFFGNVTIIPFTGAPMEGKSELAFTLLRFLTFFPIVTAVSAIVQYWTENNWLHLGMVALSVVVAHLWLQHQYRERIRLHSDQLALEEGEEEFPMKLGLRY